MTLISVLVWRPNHATLNNMRTPRWQVAILVIALSSCIAVFLMVIVLASRGD